MKYALDLHAELAFKTDALALHLEVQKLKHKLAKHSHTRDARECLDDAISALEAAASYLEPEDTDNGIYENMVSDQARGK